MRTRILLWCFLLLSWVGVVEAAPQRDNCGRPNMMLVVDISGSMTQESKLQALQTSVTNIVNKYAQSYRFGLISFKGTKANLDVQIGPENPSDYASHATKLTTAVKGFVAVGGTPMNGAMRLARTNYEKILPSDRLHKHKDANVKRVNFVLLITDGEPTDADPTPEIKKLFNLQVGTKNYQIRTFVIGLGQLPNIRPDLLKKYATAGGGASQFLQATTASLLGGKIEEAIKNALPKEICNGVDDDCDGAVDEDLIQDCNTACGKGRQQCKDAKWGACNAPSATPETCDNADNDCDGVVDNGLDRECSTACGKGKQTCKLGEWSDCTAKKPQKEICDGKDNDCDGKVDEGQELCPNGECLNLRGTKRCKIDCSDNECPSGFRCDTKTKECFLRPCAKNNPCKPGEVCEDVTGKIVCKNPCVGVDCPVGKTCGAAGICINCYDDKCPPKTICRAGRCVPDLCESKTCSGDQICRDGKCISSCQGISCTKGLICQTTDAKKQQGVCIKDPCLGASCKAKEICINGQCVENRCLRKSTSTCIKQHMCDPLTGSCVDNPCNWTRCPSGTTCFRGECLDKAPTSTGKDYGYCSKSSDCKSQGATCKNNLCLPGEPTKKPEGCECSLQGDAQDSHSLFWLVILVLWGGFLRCNRRKERELHAKDCH